MNNQLHSLAYYRRKEQEVFPTIPGMKELLQSYDHTTANVEKEYPDAVFALMTASEIMSGDRERNAINQQAYFSILQGKNIPDIRCQYRKAMDRYLQEHKWDD